MAKPKFPAQKMFKKLMRKKTKRNVANILEIIKSSSSIHDVKQKLDMISNRDIKKIERRSRLQAQSEDWFYFRKGIITSTLTKRISSFIQKGNIDAQKINKAISKERIGNINYPAIMYGRDSEALAIADFFKDFKKKHLKAKLRNVGLKIDRNLKFFGGSADGILSCECQKCDNNFILEIKAPYRLKNKSII